MDEINEQTENMKQIQEALSTPIGAAADFDEDELEAELEELESAELEEQILQPATTAPTYINMPILGPYLVYDLGVDRVVDQDTVVADKTHWSYCEFTSCRNIWPGHSC